MTEPLSTDLPERPIGITFAAVIIAVTSTCFLVLRIASGSTSPENLLWIAVHVIALLLVYGLLRLRPWPYWLLLTATCAAIVLSIGRLFGWPTTLPPYYHVARVVVLCGWLAYLVRSSVREAFIPSAHS